MPMISLKELGMTPDMVKPGDTLEMKVTKVDGDMAELSYEMPEVEKPEMEMSEDEMNDPMKVAEMDKMPPEEMKKRLPKADRSM